MSGLRALTIWPEWAWAILHAGKWIENRTWAPPASVEYIAIHAGAAIGGRRSRAATRAGLAALAEMGERAGWTCEVGESHGVLGVAFQGPDESAVSRFASVGPLEHAQARPIVTSAIVAVARVAGTYQAEEPAGWYVGDMAHGWRLKDITPLPKPYPCSGAQGLWVPPTDVLTACRAAWRNRGVARVAV